MVDSLANRIVLGATIISIIFIMVGHIYRDQVQNLLKNPLYKVDEFFIDWWSVSHFLLFSLFGFVKPGYPFTSFICGIAFEVFEDSMASDETTQIVDCISNKKSVIGGIMCNGYEDSYWYAKLDDIFINLLGYIVGQAIRTTFYPDLDLD